MFRPGVGTPRHATGKHRRPRAAPSTSGPRRGEEPARRLAAAIDRSRHEITTRWLDRVQKDVDRSGVEATLLRDGMPDYLIALVDLLAHDGKRGSEPPSESAWWKVAREHGITRVRIGFDITQLIREFVILRQVIRDVAEEEGALAGESPETLLADILDAGIIAAVKAYVEARDFEARRRQAEHIGFITHELRNPLSTATIAASQLRAHAVPEQLQLLDIVDRGHKRLTELIDSVLLTEKLEAGRVHPRPVDLRLGQVMDAALEGARASAKQKGLTFTAVYDPELRARMDPVLTRSVLQNVFDNAVRYTDEGEVRVEVEVRGDTLVVHVRDNCPGISEEELRTIFEPFSRGSTAKPGTGLGLAIARRGIEVQGGAIHAESPGPSGCHFWIELPHQRDGQK